MYQENKMDVTRRWHKHYPTGYGHGNTHRSLTWIQTRMTDSNIYGSNARKGIEYRKLTFDTNI